MAAAVATWLMNKEEEGLVNGYIPETSRLTIVKNDFVLSERKTVIRYSKPLGGSRKRVILPEVILTW